MNPAKKSIKENALMGGINRGLSLIFPLITFAYVSRVLGVENYGKYNFSQSIYSYFSLAAELGISTYAIREGVKYRDNRRNMSQFSSEIFSINMIMTFLSYLALGLLLIFNTTLKEYRACIAICSISMFFSTIGIEWFYSVYEEYGYITIRNFIFKIISLILMFIFVRGQDDYLWYAGVCVIASSGSCILNFIRSKRYCDIIFTSNNRFFSHIKSLMVFATINIAAYIYNSSDITMLGLFSTDLEVGLYSAASKMYRLSKSVLLAILTVTIPRLSKYISEQKNDEYSMLLLKIVNFMNLFMIPMVVMIVAAGKDILTIVAGTEYIGAYDSLVILTVAVIFSMYAWISGQCVLVPNNLEKDNLYSTIFGAVLNVLLNFAAIPLFGAMGAAVTTILAELFVAVYCTIKARKITKYSFGNKNLIAIIVGCVDIIIISAIVQMFVDSMVLRLLFIFIAGTVAYAISVIILRNTCAIELLKSVWKKIERNK